MMRGRRLFGQVGAGLAVGSALFAIPCATALAAGSNSTPSATQPAASVPCPTPPVAPVPGCTSGGSGSSGLSGSSAAQTSAIPPDQVLSNEMTFTQFAYVHRVANVYSQPSTKSHRVSRLTWYTEDGFNSVYVLLRAHWTSARTEWVKIRIPGRPNGRTGWVQRNALDRFHMTHQAVVINRGKERLYVYENGKQVWSAPVGVGAPGMPTPTGHFWLNEFFNLTKDPSSGYYPYAFGTTDYSTLTDWPGGGVVGIHGPYGAPASAIPGRISHGCIRLRIRDDFWLGRHMQMGTPVRVV
jgi:L,D-transpeptidase catalytic domain